MYTMLESHPVTIFVVIAAMLVTPLHLLATYAFSRASLKTGIVLSASWLIFGAIMFVVCLSDVPGKLGLAGNLIIPAVWALPSILLIINRDKWVSEELSNKWLVSLQLWRAIGAVFIIEMFMGNLPAIFALPAGIGDIAVALIAAGFLFVHRKSDRLPARAIHLVGVLGVLDFLSAFFFGFTSSATPLQLFSHDNPNPATLFPTGMIPLFLVPYAIFFHTLAWINEAKFGVKASNASANTPQPIPVPASSA